MKRLSLFAALCLALPLCAAELAVNAPATTETLKDDKTLTLDKEVVVEAGGTVLFSAKLTMTLPSDSIEQSEQADDKLVVTADADGSVLVYAGGKWYTAQGLTVDEGDTLEVSVEAKGGQDAVKYVVTLKNGDVSSTVETDEVSGLPAFNTVVLAGEGEATGLAVAAVSTGILPPPKDGSQDAELVGKFVDWQNDSDKGGAMKGATETEISDAFAMNVGGKPSLTITDITPPEGGKPGSITVAGSYVPVSADGTAVQAEAESAPLNKINGTLYITYASELGGEAKTQAVEISAADGETKTITLPPGAIFVKARVALTKPDDDTL